MVIGLVIVLSVKAYAASQTIVSLTSVTCFSGDTITLNLAIPENQGFVNARVSICYDEDVFTLTKEAQDKGLISGAFHSNKLESPYNLSWEGGSTAQNNYSEGIVAELTFKVSSSAKNGKYEIEVIVEDSMIAADGSVVDVQCINSNIYIVQNPENCSHSWGDWTSSSLKKHKRTCELCGETEYEYHEWDDGEVTEEPTEDSTGEMTYTCDVCGGTKTSVLPALEPEEPEEPENQDVSGTVTSYGTASDPVTIKLIDSNGTVVDSTDTTDSRYTLSAPDGQYTLEVSKAKHATREYSVNISGADVALDVKICLLGDVTGDGKVNIADAFKLARYVKNSTKYPLGDNYCEKCAEVSGDNKVNIADAFKLARYTKNSIKYPLY